MNKEWKLRMQKTGGTIAAVAMGLGIAETLYRKIVGK